MVTFQFFFQSGWAKDLSAPLYKGKRAGSEENKTRARYGLTQNVRINTAEV